MQCIFHFFVYNISLLMDFLLLLQLFASCFCNEANRTLMKLLIITVVDFHCRLILLEISFFIHIQQKKNKIARFNFGALNKRIYLFSKKIYVESIKLLPKNSSANKECHIILHIPDKIEGERKKERTIGRNYSATTRDRRGMRE